MVAKSIRFVVLSLAVAFGIVSMGIGINALIKSDDAKKFVKSHAPPGVSVTIDTSDVLNVGTVVTVVSGLTALSSFLALVAFTFATRTPSSSCAHPVKPRTLRLFSYIHLFFVVWLLAALIAYDAIARTRQARVSASLGGLQLPQSIIDQQQAALGVSPVYWQQNYLRWLAIIPWFVLLSGLIASFSLFRASNETRADSSMHFVREQSKGMMKQSSSLEKSAVTEGHEDLKEEQDREEGEVNEKEREGQEEGRVENV